MTEEKREQDEVESQNEVEQQGEVSQDQHPEGVSVTEEPNPETLQKEIEELNQRVLRVSADFDNFRRRARIEKEEMAKYANTNLINQLLPIIDSFKLAIDVKEPNSEIKGFLTGFEMIFRQLTQVLTQAGLEPIESKGTTFDPQKHEAVMQVEEAEAEDNTVLEDLRTGYIFKDKVIRPSMVKVVKNT